LFLFAPIKWAIKLFSLVLTAGIIYLFVTGVQIVLAENSIGIGSVSSQKVGAIVLLVPEQSGIAATPDLVSRLQTTLSLFQSHISRSIILASSQREGFASVFRARKSTAYNDGLMSAARWLHAHGVTGSDIAGSFGGTTYDSLRSAAQRITRAHQVVIVTDAIDRLWVSHTAGAAGLNVERIYSAVGSKQFFTHELGTLWTQDSGVAAGRIIGFSHTTWPTG